MCLGCRSRPWRFRKVRTSLEYGSDDGDSRRREAGISLASERICDTEMLLNLDCFNLSPEDRVRCLFLRLWAAPAKGAVDLLDGWLRTSVTRIEGLRLAVGLLSGMLLARVKCQATYEKPQATYCTHHHGRNRRRNHQRNHRG